MGSYIGKYRVQQPKWATYKNNCWPDAETLYEKIQKYALHCEEEERKPSVTGFPVFCGRSVSALYRREERARERGEEEFLQVLSFFKDWCKDELQQASLAGRADSRAMQIILVNDHKQLTNSNKSEQTREVKNVHTLSPDLAEMIENVVKS